MVNMKGGVGKTTSAVFLACALAETGSVLVVDADPQGSLSLWAETATDLPFTTVAVPSAAVARQVRDLAGRYDHVVIDCPPGHAGIVAAVLSVAEVAMVPITTGSVDLVRFAATVELIETAAAVNDKLRGVVLLTKTRSGTASRREVRAALVEHGVLPVLEVEVPLRESIAAAEGTTPADVGVYAEALAELKGMW